MDKMKKYTIAVIAILGIYYMLLTLGLVWLVANSYLDMWHGLFLFIISTVAFLISMFNIRKTYMENKNANRGKEIF